MKTKIEDLREHLFLTLERLNDEDNPMDLDRAKAVASVASVVIDSAKAETDRLKVVADLGFTSGSDFMPENPKLIGQKDGAGKTQR